uniref:Uncharacterized protein n=1 Tax=Glossina pallidipes TaxID=7398 RepID=A0A1B0AC56_GLOPL
MSEYKSMEKSLTPLDCIVISSHCDALLCWYLTRHHHHEKKRSANLSLRENVVKSIKFILQWKPNNCISLSELDELLGSNRNIKYCKCVRETDNFCTYIYAPSLSKDIMFIIENLGRIGSLQKY